jgi:hypothetical protein
MGVSGRLEPAATRSWHLADALEAPVPEGTWLMLWLYCTLPLAPGYGLPPTGAMKQVYSTTERACQVRVWWGKQVCRVTAAIPNRYQVGRVQQILQWWSPAAWPSYTPYTTG